MSGALDAAGRHQPSPAVIYRGRPSRDANGTPSGVHNVTPREDYRTALLSDSPDTGCSLSFAWRRVDSEPNPAGCASAVLRRSRRRRGRFSAVDCGGPRSASGRRRNAREGTAAFRPRARGTNSNPPIGSAFSRTQNNKTNQRSNQSRAVDRNLRRQHTEIPLEFWLLNQIRGYLRQ